MNGQVPQENNQNNLNTVGLGEVQNLGNLDPNVNVNVPSDEEIINNIMSNQNIVSEPINDLDKTTVIEPIIEPVQPIPSEPVVAPVVEPVQPIPSESVVAPVIETVQPIPSEPVVAQPVMDNVNNIQNDNVYYATSNTDNNIQMLEQTPLEQSIPVQGVSTINTVNTTDVNQSNSFVETSSTLNIGVTPPVKDVNKKSSNKILIILLAVILIAGIGYGIYFYLNLAKKNKVKLIPKDLVVHIGTPLPGNPSDYATIEDGDIKNCKVSTINVNTNVLGEYEYTIICGSDSFKGKLTIADIAKPLATQKNVFVVANRQITADAFSSGCTKEVCNYYFVNEQLVQEQIKTEGEYIVEIKIVDGAKNESTFKSTMFVLPVTTNVIMECKSQEEVISLENVQGVRKVIDDLFSINNNNLFGGFSRRLYTYTFHDKEIYDQFAKDKPEELTIENNTGKAVYNDATNSITIKQELTLEQLNKEFNGSFPQTYGEIRGSYSARVYNVSIIRL